LKKALFSRRCFDARTVKSKRKQRSELAPTKDETERAKKPDETEPPSAIGHPKEDRMSERQAKNTTGLKPAWNAKLQARSVKNQ